MMRINRTLFLYLSLGFFLSVIIGTVSHEFGHYLVAKYYGCKPIIHYGSVTHINAVNTIQSVMITVGGPLITLLIGTSGLVYLIVNYRKFRMTNALNVYQWLAVLITLFWLRPAINFLMWIFGWIRRGRFSLRSDEVGLASYFELPLWSITSICALIGFLVLTVVLFKFIPNKQRATFLLSGIVGGGLGYVFWLESFGNYGSSPNGVGLNEYNQLRLMYINGVVEPNPTT